MEDAVQTGAFLLCSLVRAKTGVQNLQTVLGISDLSRGYLGLWVRLH
jgi:hypothetical protein